MDLMSDNGGHEETAVFDDVWACAQGRMSLEQFLFRHGYRGPFEGEISAAKMWREDPHPVQRLIESYRSKGIPNSDKTERVQRRRTAENEFL